MRTLPPDLPPDHNKIIFYDGILTRSGLLVGQNQDGGSFFIRTGSGSDGNPSGNILLITGNNTSGDTGSIEITTSEGEDGVSGEIILRTQSSQNNGSSGRITIETSETNRSGSESGSINLRTGISNDQNTRSGSINLITGYSQQTNFGTGSSGDVLIRTGSSSQNSGFLFLQTGDSESGYAGSIEISAGAGQFPSGNPGSVYIRAGSSNSSNIGGMVQIDGGPGYSDGGGGPVIIRGGEYYGYDSSYNAGTVTISGGNSYNVATPGNVALISGNSFTNDSVSGQIIISSANTNQSSLEDLSGEVQIRTGNVFGRNQSRSGNINISTGNYAGIMPVQSQVNTGNINLRTGTSNNNSISLFTGNISISTGASNRNSGNIEILTGNTNSNSEGNTGTIVISSGQTVSQNIKPGDVIIRGGSILNNSSIQQAGSIQITAGSSNSRFGGNILLTGGNSGSTTDPVGGNITILGGNPNGEVVIRGGTSTVNNFKAGNITIRGGDSNSNSDGGNVVISSGTTSSVSNNSSGNILIETASINQTNPNIQNNAAGNIIIRTGRRGASNNTRNYVALSTHNDGFISFISSGNSTTSQEIRFYDNSQSLPNFGNFFGLRAPNTISSSLTYTLPDQIPLLDGAVLVSNRQGVMSWVYIEYWDHNNFGIRYARVAATNTNANSPIFIYQVPVSLYTGRAFLVEATVLAAATDGDQNSRASFLIRCTGAYSNTGVGTMGGNQVDYQFATGNLVGSTCNFQVNGNFVNLVGTQPTSQPIRWLASFKITYINMFPT